MGSSLVLGTCSLFVFIIGVSHFVVLLLVLLICLTCCLVVAMFCYLFDLLFGGCCVLFLVECASVVRALLFYWLPKYTRTHTYGITAQAQEMNDQQVSSTLIGDNFCSLFFV